jgi:hypothetical protein
VTPELVQEEIRRVRDSGVLGRSRPLAQLFDFLAERPRDAPAAKESEIALSVFGRGGSFSTDEDAVVRVYAHRLRRKLEDFNGRGASPLGVRLSLPRGEYRIAAEPLDAQDEAADTPPRPSRPRWLVAALAIGAVALVAALVGFGLHRHATRPAQARAPWSALKADTAPLVIVVGDYYLFGENGEHMEISRLIREFSINSRDELYAYMMRNPDTSGRYADLGLTYLPLSTASALAHVMPLLPPGKPVRIVPASSFSPELLKSADILYLGHLSGLGVLRETAFSGSRFTFGETYDEIIDQRSGRRFVGEAGADAAGGLMYRDYGYLAAFPGPTGNRIMVLAGTRDASAQGVSEAAATVASLERLAQATNGADAFEALYEVHGKGATDIETRLVLASPLDAASIWSGRGAAARLPAG